MIRKRRNKNDRLYKITAGENLRFGKNYSEDKQPVASGES